ncbi:hypothetical protein N7527_001868 [Penicillium freii]|nr:hypothetical protein N7527_001868 [Penicillium freii]
MTVHWRIGDGYCKIELERGMVSAETVLPCDMGEPTMAAGSGTWSFKLEYVESKDWPMKAIAAVPG